MKQAQEQKVISLSMGAHLGRDGATYHYSETFLTLAQLSFLLHVLILSHC